MGKKLPPKPSGVKPSGIKIVTDNRKAGFRYHFIERYEAGMVLKGSEVKSLRDGKANLGDAYVVHHNGEMVLIHCHISPYPPANRLNHEPLRSRKLLMHRQQIEHLLGKMKERGLTLIPTKLYFKSGKAKCEIALAKGKTFGDQRDDLRKKDHIREMERALRRKR